MIRRRFIGGVERKRIVSFTDRLSDRALMAIEFAIVSASVMIILAILSVPS